MNITMATTPQKAYQWACDINGFTFILIRALVPLTNLNIAIDRTIAVTLPLKYSKIMNSTSVVGQHQFLDRVRDNYS